MVAVGGDIIESVDLKGQRALVRTSKQAGVGHFTFVSIPRSPVRASPLTLAKYRMEEALPESGVAYLILARTSL